MASKAVEGISLPKRHQPEVNSDGKSQLSASVQSETKESDSASTEARQSGGDKQEEDASGLSKAEIQEILNSGGISGDEEFLWEMIAATNESAAEKISMIDTYASKGQWGSASRVCHTLKGSSGMLQMKGLWAACLEGEQALKSLAAQVDPAATRLDDRCKTAIAELKLQISRLGKTEQQVV